MSNVEQRLQDLGFEIPAVAPPIGSFCATLCVGDLIYVSGHTSILKDVAAYKGQLGTSIGIEDATKGAQIAALRCIGALAGVVELDRVKIVKVTGFVNAATDFTQHPAVINGASDLLLAVFGENGKHARCAIGVSSLPGNACVEIEVIAQILS